METMTKFPIVQRELLVSSRKRLTFWVRIGSALIGFTAVLFIVGLDPDATIAGALGAKLFRWLSTSAFFACLAGGAFLTADCLSVEKREGTLGLLFLTDLKGYDVVLGKLAAKSITALLCLLAISPMLAVPILLGGVTGGDFWRVVLVLLNTLFLSACVGMVVSVFCREGRNAIATAEFLLYVLVIGASVLSQVLRPSWQIFPGLLSPLSSFGAAVSSRFWATFFYPSLLVQHLIGWGCLLVAGARAQTCWHERPTTNPSRRSWREFLRGNSAERLALRRALLAINPLLWLESRDRLMRVLLACMFASLAVAGWFLNRHPIFHWSDMRYAIWTVIFLHVLLTMLLAFEVSVRMVETKRDGALTVVLSTRLSVEDVLRGEFLAARRTFGWPLVIVLAFDFIWLLGVLMYDRRPNDAENAFIGILCLGAVLVANCYGLVWVSLHNAMRARRPYRAALRSFVEIVVAPVFWFGFILLGSKGHGSMAFGIIMFALLDGVNTWLFGSGGYQRFKTDLREILTEHPRPPEKNYGEDYALLSGPLRK